MEYCSAVWDPYEKGDTETLEKVQRRAAHFVKEDYRQLVQRYPNDQRPRLAESARTSSYQQIVTYVQNSAWSI